MGFCCSWSASWDIDRPECVTHVRVFLGQKRGDYRKGPRKEPWDAVEGGVAQTMGTFLGGASPPFSRQTSSVCCQPPPLVLLYGLHLGQARRGCFYSSAQLPVGFQISEGGVNVWLSRHYSIACWSKRTREGDGGAAVTNQLQ